MKAIFDEVGGTYAIDGAAVEAVQVKGAAEAVIAHTQGEMAKLADRLAAGQIEVQEFYDSFKGETKYLHMAQAALARGGFDRMGDADWRRVEKIVEQQWSGVEGQFPGLRAFAEDVQNGRYGTQELRRGFNSRARAYADAGRATYENERLAGRMESGPLEAMRERGFSDGCRDCVAWARLGWIDARTMFDGYPIASSVCGVNCHCVIITRRAKVENQIKNLIKTLIKAAAPLATVASVGLFLLRLAVYSQTGVLIDIAALSSQSVPSGTRQLLTAAEQRRVDVAALKLDSKNIAVDLGGLPPEVAEKVSAHVLDVRRRFPQIKFHGVQALDLEADGNNVLPMTTNLRGSSRQILKCTLRINRKMFDGQTVKQFEDRLKRRAAAGDFAYESIEDLIEHESAHVLFFQGVRTNQRAKALRKLRGLQFDFGGASLYGESSPIEGISECFVMARKGQLGRVSVTRDGQLFNVRDVIKLYTGVKL